METQVCNDWTLMTEIELVYKNKMKVSERPYASCSREAYKLFMGVWNMDQLELREDFLVLFVNKRNRVLGYLRLASGGFDCVGVDSRLIFATALKIAARGIVLAHNHPSGDLTPSKADIETTRSIKAAGDILGIVLQDHLIIGIEANQYRSMADNAELL